MMDGPAVLYAAGATLVLPKAAAASRAAPSGLHAAFRESNRVRRTTEFATDSRTRRNRVSLKYLLPCECGIRIPVGKAQAGEVVSCSCGRRIEVPTLLRLRDLDTIEDDQPLRAADSSWDIRNGLIAIGVAITLLAAAGAAYFFFNRPARPDEQVPRELLQQRVDTMPLIKTYEMWEYLRHGLHGKRPINVDYQRAMKAYRIRLGVTLVILAAAGGATLVGGLALAHSKRAARNGS